MSYFDQTIKEVLKEIEDGKLFLPAIQRKFVWSEDQITRLFDSLMRGYPIGTFLFWDIDKDKEEEKIRDFVFYDFIREYHERDMNQNQIRTAIIKNNFKVALDGQQRLTALYIGLMGSLSLKEPRKYWSNDDAFPKRELYLNVSRRLSSDDEEEESYEFRFLDSRKIPEDGSKWLKASDILKFKDSSDLMVSKLEEWNLDEVKIAGKFWEVICLQKFISYFSITDTDMDEVLDIFVRVNSAGTVLSKSDLIFSTLTAKWAQGRELIDSLIKTINRTTKKFTFNNDFVMRTLLYINDLSINLKVESFKENVTKIRTNYDLVEKAIKDMVNLIEEFGFSDENITSYSALLPIVYFIYKNGSVKESKFELIKYFIIAQLKNIFISGSNSVLTDIRKSLVEDTKNYKLKYKNFELKQFYDLTFSGDRNFKFTDEELNKLFDYSKGKYTFMVLSLLYPEIKVNEVEFHQDHMHPIYGFKEKNLKSVGFTDDEIIELIHMKDQLPNLQLLKGKDNESKNKKPLIKWIEEGNQADKFTPKNVSLELHAFKTFYEQRKNLMKEKLKSILDVS